MGGTHRDDDPEPSSISVLSPLTDEATSRWARTSDADSSRDVEDLKPGRILFDRYELVRLLGRGGFGEVWQVRHRVLQADFVLKLLHPRGAADDRVQAFFLRNARVMAGFSHPNVASIYDAGWDDRNNAYLVMEHVRGRTLSEVLQRDGPMSPERLAPILAQLCDALQAAHERGIIHRDLKPSNVMLSEGRSAGEVHATVVDFGLAKVFGEADIEARALVGTPAYMSPEQAEGRADPRSDIYSVGVILYEALTGRRPFSGTGPRQIFDRMHTPPPPLSKANPAVGVPPAVERVVIKCLASRPGERYHSAGELADDFQAALQAPPAKRIGRLGRQPAEAALSGPPARWAEFAGTLRSIRETRRSSWGDIDDATLSRFVAGRCSDEERARVDDAIRRSPRLRRCLDLARDALVDPDRGGE